MQRPVTVLIQPYISGEKITDKVSNDEALVNTVRYNVLISSTKNRRFKFDYHHSDIIGGSFIDREFA